MPAERQRSSTVLSMGTPTGGMNTALPETQIAENEAVLIENYEYDYSQLKTRGGLSAPLATLPENIDSFFYDKATGYCHAFCGTNIYAVKENGTAAKIGILTGNERPSCCKFGGEVFIGSGGKLQYYDYTTLATIEGSFLSDNVFVKSGRLITTKRGDDNIRFSSTGDAKSSEAWTEDTNVASSYKYLEAGYKDDGDIITSKLLAGDIITFKTFGGIYDTAGDYPAWTQNTISEDSGAIDGRCIEVVGNSIVFVTPTGLKNIAAVQAYGNLNINGVGYKINNTLKKMGIVDPLTWNLVNKRQLVIAPNVADRSKLLIYQYDIEAGYLVTFPLPVSDMAETDNGVLVAMGKNIYRWSAASTTDNGVPIKTHYISRKVTTMNKFITRSFYIETDGDRAGTITVKCGNKSFNHHIGDTKLKSVSIHARELQVDLQSDNTHELNQVSLYVVSV